MSLSELELGPDEAWGAKELACVEELTAPPKFVFVAMVGMANGRTDAERRVVRHLSQTYPESKQVALHLVELKGDFAARAEVLTASTDENLGKQLHESLLVYIPAPSENVQDVITFYKDAFFQEPDVPE